jgi:hypothetical protein
MLRIGANAAAIGLSAAARRLSATAIWNLHQHWTCVMRTDPAAVLDAASTPTSQRHGNGLVADIAQFWRQFVVTAFNPYRPEKHYMRGPGPAWRAKHMANTHGDSAAS